MELFFLLLMRIQGVLVGSLCSYVAGQKNRSKGNWFFLGFLFSLLALIALAAVPTLSKKDESRHAPSEIPESAQSTAAKMNSLDSLFVGDRDLVNDEYKIWLVDRYNITKNEALAGLVCDKKIFQTIDAALSHAHELYTAELPMLAAQHASANASMDETALAQRHGIVYGEERYIWQGNYFKTLSTAVAFAERHSSSEPMSNVQKVKERQQVDTPVSAELAAKLRLHGIKFEEDRYIWQGNYFKKPLDAIAYAKRSKSA